MLKVAVSDTLAQKILQGQQDLIVTDHDYDDAGDLITLVSNVTHQPLLYASLDYCVCDVADNLFQRLKTMIRDFTQQDFKQAIHNQPLAFVLVVSHPQAI